MKALILCATALALSVSAAQAGKREDCAASTGAKSGAAFTACMNAGKSANTSQPRQPLYKDPGSRALPHGQMLR
jgi:hypothetical protein